MKKLSALILALLATCCIACTSNVQQEPPIESPHPWQCDSDFLSETCKYDVVKYFVGSDDMKYAVTENSYLEYKISAVKEGVENCYSLDTHFVIHYVENDYNDLSGCTDEIVSTAVFNRATLKAVRTTKEVKLETSPELSYKFEVDYAQGTAVYGSGDTHIEKTFPVTRSYIDNEYLYYYIRCFKGLSENFDMAFDVINWYSCFKRNSVATTAIRARFVGKENVAVPSELITHFGDDAKDTSDDASNLISDTMLVCPTRTAKTGQPIRVSYASGAYVSGDAQSPMYNTKLISKMMVFEYTLPETLTYTTEYTLSDVSVLLQ